MITIPTEEQAVWQGSASKNITLIFSDGTEIDNNSICSESMELDQTICEETSTMFGNVYSSVFRIRVFDNGDGYAGLGVNPMINIITEDGFAYLVDNDGKYLTDDSGNKLIIKSGTYTKRLGSYTVYSDKLFADGIYRELVCYDALQPVLQTDYASWHNGLDYPLTVKQYRDAFFAHVGIRQEAITLVNDSMYIYKNTKGRLNGREIIASILSLNAVWGYIGVYGRFKYVVPKTTTDVTIDDNSYIQGSCAFEEYVTTEFTKVTFNISAEATDGTVESEISVGTDGGNVLTINDNVLLFNKTQADLTTIGNAILTQLDGFSYRPTTVTFPPYMGLELGDTFTINTYNGRQTTFPVLSRRLTGISALRDTFTANGDELLHENANSLVKKITDATVKAGGANIAANSALTKVSTVDEVVDILGWVGDYGEYEATSDTEVVSGKYYFTKDSEQTVEPTIETQSLRGGMTLMASSLTATANETEPTATGYTYVENPTGNPSENGYYELSGVSSAVSKYLKTHLKMESDGLYVLLDDSGFRLRITNTAVQVINESGTVVGEYSTTTTIGDSTDGHIYIDNDSVDIMKADDRLASFGLNSDDSAYITLGNAENSETDGTNYFAILDSYRGASLTLNAAFSGSGQSTFAAISGSSIEPDEGETTATDSATLMLADTIMYASTGDGLTIDDSVTINDNLVVGEVDYTLTTSTINLWKSILGLS